MSLIPCFNFWSALKWSGSWTADDHCRSLTAEIFYSMEHFSREYLGNIMDFELHVALKKRNYHSGCVNPQVQPTHKAIL